LPRQRPPQACEKSTHCSHQIPTTKQASPSSNPPCFPSSAAGSLIGTGIHVPEWLNVALPDNSADDKAPAAASEESTGVQSVHQLASSTKKAVLGPLPGYKPTEKKHAIPPKPSKAGWHSGDNAVKEAARNGAFKGAKVGAREGAKAVEKERQQRAEQSFNPTGRAYGEQWLKDHNKRVPIYVAKQQESAAQATFDASAAAVSAAHSEKRAADVLHTASRSIITGTPVYSTAKSKINKLNSLMDDTALAMEQASAEDAQRRQVEAQIETTKQDIRLQEARGARNHAYALLQEPVVEAGSVNAFQPVHLTETRESGGQLAVTEDDDALMARSGVEMSPEAAEEHLDSLLELEASLPPAELLLQEGLEDDTRAAAEDERELLKQVASEAFPAGEDEGVTLKAEDTVEKMAAESASEAVAWGNSRGAGEGEKQASTAPAQPATTVATAVSDKPKPTPVAVQTTKLAIPRKASDHLLKEKVPTPHEPERESSGPKRNAADMIARAVAKALGATPPKPQAAPQGEASLEVGHHTVKKSQLEAVLAEEETALVVEKLPEDGLEDAAIDAAVSRGLADAFGPSRI